MKNIFYYLAFCFSFKYNYTMTTIISCDYGLKQIGIACSDEEQTMAFPYGVISTSKKNDILDILKKYKSKILVMGWPNSNRGVCFKHRSSLDSDILLEKEILTFANNILNQINIEIYFFDESFSTLIAADKIYDNRDYFLKGQKTKSKKFKTIKDTLAAYVILKSFLDYIAKPF